MTFSHPIITVEEHWLSETVRDIYLTKGSQNPYATDGLIGSYVSSLLEFGDKRLKSMDDGSVTLQVVSHAPNTIALDPNTCVKVNNELHNLITSRQKGRFAGFATLPMNHPEAAAEELERCVKELGFLGALIDSNCEGRYYDGDPYHPLWSVAEKLDVPVYLHPSPNEHTKPLLYDGNYSDSIAETLSQYAWGWHNDTAVHFLRLLAAKVFDRFPRLQLVLGHQGELLPFQLDRIEGIVARAWPHIGGKLERQLRQVWDENVWVSISGVFYMAPMMTVLMQCKPERIMYSVDYPFGDNAKGLEFLETLKEKSEGRVNDEILEGIAHKNAERLLKVKAVSI